MGYETECSDEQLADLNEVRRLAGMRPITETSEQTYERRTRNLAKRREDFDRDLEAYICRRHASQSVAASRGATPPGAAEVREQMAAEVRMYAGMKPAGRPVAAALTPTPVVPVGPQPVAPPGVAERQSAAKKAQAVATGVVDSVDPRGPAGKAIADAIKKQQQALTPEQRESFRTLKDVLFNATKTALLANPALAKAGALKALAGYLSQWMKDEQVEGNIDPDDEAAELWANVVDVVEGMRKLQKESAAQPAQPAAPGTNPVGLARTFTLHDAAGQPITRPLTMVRHPVQ